MERMKEMQRKLHDAAVEGNATSLRRLLDEDTLVLDRLITSCPVETPLHVAAMLGHLEFTIEVLTRKPELAKEVDHFHKSTPLHLATANGHLEVVKELLVANPDMCLAKNRDGHTPLHIAVIKGGRVDILKELIRVKPEAVHLRGERGETVLHLCVEHCQLDALKFLLKTVDPDNKNVFLNHRDDYGLNILHLAVVKKDKQIINFLISETAIEKNVPNAFGFTALDIAIVQSGRDAKDIDILNIFNSLRQFGAVRGRDTDVSPSKHNLEATVPMNSSLTAEGRNQGTNHNMDSNRIKWLKDKKNALMLVASILATMAFQAGINPPNGVWQEDSPELAPYPHVAGMSIMADKYPHYFNLFIIFNTLSFLTSILVILLLISGLPMRHRFSMWILMVSMWLAILAAVLAYTTSICNLSRCKDAAPSVANTVIRVQWMLIMGSLLFLHCCRLIWKLGKFVRKKLCSSSLPVRTSNANNV